MTTPKDTTTPVTIIDLSNEAEVLSTTGHTLAVVLPDGTTLDLWVYDHPSTTSVDVRYRQSHLDVNDTPHLPIVRSFPIGDTQVVVLRGEH